MTILSEKDYNVLMDYLVAYREAFEALNDLASSLSKRVELTPDEIELANKSEAKYKNMLYHLRKWNPKLKARIK